MKLNIKKIINFFDYPTVINITNKFALNKQRIIKEKAIQEILDEIKAYFEEHYIKKFIIAEEAKLMQKYYFKKQISSIKNPKIKQEYETLLKKLDQISDNEEIIQFLCNYYLNDMAADLNPAFLIFFKEMCKIMYHQFIKNVKVKINENTIHLLREIQGKFPLFYLPNHISNADHIPIAFSLNRMKLFHPVIVAGANLYKGVSKLLLPKLNVEKLRRDFITDKSKWLQNPLYRLCFVKYNNYLWENNEPFLFYIEGGRSRNGLINEPKYGIISEIFNFIKNNKKVSYFVPVTISYTIVPEDIELYEATKGKNITDADLFNHLTKLNKEYKKFKDPKIYVNILNPIKIEPEEKLDHKSFSKQIIEILRKNIIPTPTYLLAKILIDNPEIEIDKLENIYNQHADREETTNKFKNAINIFLDKKFIEIQDSYVKVLHRDLILQYSNRIKYLT